MHASHMIRPHWLYIGLMEKLHCKYVRESLECSKYYSSVVAVNPSDESVAKPEQRNNQQPESGARQPGSIHRNTRDRPGQK